MQEFLGFDGAIRRLADRVYNTLSNIDTSLKKGVYEVRLRVGQPLQIVGDFGTYFVRFDSSVSSDYKACGYSLSENDISESMNKVCDYSIHTHLDQIQKGFVTIQGGHRVGISGTAVMKDGEVYNIRDVSSLNLRVAHQVFGASKLVPDEVAFGKDSLIFAGAPASGKTTILRDISRRLSERGKKVVIVDERSEIAAVYAGRVNNDLGPCCDILSGFPKTCGILTALRSLSPDVIVCDEIGDVRETETMLEGLNSGVRFLVSMHADSIQALKNKPQFMSLYRSGQFGFAVILYEFEKQRNAKIINLKEQI